MYIGDWSACSATCGGGTQSRAQSCVYSDNTTAEGKCLGHAENETRSCNENPCREYWQRNQFMYASYHGIYFVTPPHVYRHARIYNYRFEGIGNTLLYEHMIYMWYLEHLIVPSKYGLDTIPGIDSKVIVL